MVTLLLPNTAKSNVVSVAANACEETTVIRSHRNKARIIRHDKLRDILIFPPNSRRNVDREHKVYGGPGFLGHEIVLNLVTKENEYGKGWKPPWCSGGRA